MSELFDWHALFDFWFGGVQEDSTKLPERLKLWFFAGESEDEEIRVRFGSWLSRAHAVSSVGRYQTLTAVILFDQFPRHLFRGSALAFEYDANAYELALGLLDQIEGFHPLEQIFLLLPFQHRENLDDQRVSLEGFRRLKRDSDVDHRDFFNVAEEKARLHFEVIERFGRFPHRNAILSRESTSEEQALLEDRRYWF